MIGIVVGLYPIVSKQNPSLALGYAAFRLLESTLVIVGIISLLSIVTLGHEFAKETNP